MADVVVERALYKLEGDGASYQKMMKDAENATKKFASTTEKIAGQTKKLDELDETLEDLAGKAKDFTEAFGMTKASSSIDTLTKGWDSLHEKLGSAKELADAWGKRWTTVLGYVQLGFGKLAGTVGGLSKSLQGASTAGGALSFGLKAGVYIAIAAAVAYTAKTVYDYTVNVQDLSKELEKNQEKVNEWAESYRAATTAIVEQSTFIPTAQGKLRYFFSEWDTAEEQMDGLLDRRKKLEGEIRTAQMGAYGAGAFSESVFGVDMKTAQEGLKNWEKTSDQMGFLERQMFKLSSTGQDVSVWIGGLWDSEAVKRYKNELDGVNTQYKAMDERLGKLAEQIGDRSKKVEGSFRQMLGSVQTDVTTLGMSDSQKGLYGMREQLNYFKGASEAFEAVGDFDRSDAVWSTYKALKNIFDAYKVASNQKAIQKVQGSYKLFVKDLEDSIATIGMSEIELRKWRLEQENIKRGGVISPAHMDQLDELIKKRGEAFASKKMMDEGKSLTQKLLTDAEKAATAFAEIEEMYESGAISERTYWRALDELEKKYGDVEKSAKDLASAMQGINAIAFGSAEHLARLMAQQESFRPIIAASKEPDYAKRYAEEFRSMGPQEDEFLKRQRLMGPGIPDITRLSREGEVEREFDRLRQTMKIGEEDFTGPVGSDFYIKKAKQAIDDISSGLFGQGFVGPTMPPEVASIRKAVEDKRKRREIRRYGYGWGTDFVGPTVPRTVAIEREEEAGLPERQSEGLNVLKGILDVLKSIRDNPSVEIEEADFDEFGD